MTCLFVIGLPQILLFSIPKKVGFMRSHKRKWIEWNWILKSYFFASQTSALASHWMSKQALPWCRRLLLWNSMGNFLGHRGSWARSETMARSEQLLPRRTVTVTAPAIPMPSGALTGLNRQSCRSPWPLWSVCFVIRDYHDYHQGWPWQNVHLSDHSHETMKTKIIAIKWLLSLKKID